MPTQLVIVESPAKAKTIKKYLGTDFTVLASYGHVRDLIPKEGAVDTENDYTMHYQAIDKNKKYMQAIMQAVKSCNTLYLATDPDREGEAISWHVCELLKEKKLLKKITVHRIVFHEITRAAVRAAIQSPRELALALVNAYKARRALDYLVGFTLSPLLWKKIRRGLSAGRVQSPALRMICEREDEIEKFKSQEYWSIIANNTIEGQHFTARLISYKGEKVEQFTFINDAQATDVKNVLLKAANGQLVVAKVEKKQRKRNPSAPFTTSTLQQEAIRKLGFTAQRAMRAAQQLYEGIDLGDGTTGLITYMRTDSVHLAAEAVQEIRQLIQDKYGKENLPDEPRVYKTKAKNAQEAHEAIRPTSVGRTPDMIKEYVSAEQFKLYSLIWKRAVASQMIHATIDTVTVDLRCADAGTFRANGSVITDAGFMQVYQEDHDDDKMVDPDEKILPPLKEGDKVDLNNIDCHQHFTEPPPRYTEASLIKTLEEYGIGRPSTYNAIIYTLQNRKYADLDNKRFYPTDVGRIVNKFLMNYFTQYVDYDFTAKLEDELDAVARDEKEWVPLLDEFWIPFKKLIVQIGETVQRKDVTQEKIDEKCPKCKKDLSIRLGRYNRFIGCTGYPECDYTRSVEANEETEKEVKRVEGRHCPECKGDLVVRHGRYGEFIGCSQYPKCKFIEPLHKPTDTGVVCPTCHTGSMLKRKTHKGKIFYSCGRYPECSYAVWDEPLNQPCSACKWPMMTRKITKSKGTQIICAQKSCGHIEQAD